MRAPIHGNDPHVVNHLDDNRHVAGHLNDLIVVVVEPRHHGARQTACDAPRVGSKILRPVGWTDFSRLRLLCRHLLCRRGQRRQAPILRFQEQRRPVLRERVTRLEPDACGIPRPLSHRLLRDRFRFAFLLAFDGAPRKFSSLRTAQFRSILELIRALKGCRGHVVPDPLQIGVAPRRAWLLPFCTAGLRRPDLPDRGDHQQQHYAEQREQRSQRSATHVNLRLCEMSPCSSVCNEHKDTTRRHQAGQGRDWIGRRRRMPW